MNLRYYITYLPVLIGVAAFFVIALVLWLTGRRELANSRGGLDWVKTYRADSFDLTKERLTANGHDWLCLFAVAVVSVLLAAGVALLRSDYETGSWFAGFFTLKTACKLVFYAVGACTVCWFVQDLFHDDTLGVCGGILFAASFVGSHTSMSLLAVSLLLMLRWLAQEDDAPLLPRVLWMLAGIAVIAAAASRMLGLVWVAVGYFVLIVYKCIRRYNAVPSRLWEVFVIPVVSVLAWVVCYCVSVVGVLVVVGLADLTDVPHLLVSSVVLRAMWRAVSVPKLIVTGPVNKGLLMYALTDAPLLLLGGFGFFTAIRTAKDRHDSSALLSVLVLLLLGLTWVFSREYCLLPGLVLCSICLLSRFTAAGKKAPVILFTVLACGYYIMLYVMAYLLRISPIVVEMMT